MKYIVFDSQLIKNDITDRALVNPRNLMKNKDKSRNMGL